MTQHGTHTHDNPAHGPATPFTPAETTEFHAQDRSAATAIVGLMVGIFLIGVVLYLGVIYFVKTS